MTRRTDRIGAELLAELSRLLRRDVTDPRLALVTFTRADVAPDLSQALVFWSSLDLDAEASAEHIEERQDGLESAAPFLRRKAARTLPLRRMPALRFRYDPSFVLGGRTLEVLREVAPAGGDDPQVEITSDPAGEGSGGAEE